MPVNISEFRSHDRDTHFFNHQTRRDPPQPDWCCDQDAGGSGPAHRRIQMTKEQAEGFYSVNKERPFFNDIVSFMISGQVVVQVLEADDAVTRNSPLMGAPNTTDAAEGTNRHTHE